MKKLPNYWVYVALLSFTGVGWLTFTEGCTPGARATAAVDGIKVALCVAENQDLPPAQVIAKCVTENVSAEDVTKILEQQKAATSRAAAKQGGCSRESGDAGAAKDGSK